MSKLYVFKKTIFTFLLVLFIDVILLPVNISLGSDHSEHFIGSNIQWATIIDKFNIIMQVIVVFVASSLLITKYYLSKINREEHSNFTKYERLFLLFMLFVFVITNSNNNEIPYKIIIAMVWNIAAWFNILPALLRTTIKYISSVSLLALLCLEQISEHTFISITFTVTSFTSKYAIVVWLSFLITHYVYLITNKSKDDKELVHADIRVLPIISVIYLICIALTCIIVTALFIAKIDYIYIINSYIFLILTLCSYFILRKGIKNFDSNNSFYQFKQHLRTVINISIISSVLIFINPFSVSTMPALLKEPVFWHVMGDDSHMSFRINAVQKKSDHLQFKLDLWLPTYVGEPSSIEVKLISADATVDIPMQLETAGPDPYGFEGFDKFTYKAIESYTTEHDNFIVIILATDQNGKVYTYEKEVVQ